MLAQSSSLRLSLGTVVPAPPRKIRHHETMQRVMFNFERLGDFAVQLARVSITQANVAGNDVPGRRRNVGKDSTALASEAHSERIARLSAMLRDGSSTTSASGAERYERVLCVA